MKNWSTYQEAVFNFMQNGTGSAVIEAVAGSGKSTTILHGVSLLRGDIAMMAFNSKIAKALQLKLSQMSLPNVNANTCHSFGNSAFKQAGMRPVLMNDNKGKVGRILDAMLKPQEQVMAYTIKMLVKFAKAEGFGFIHPIMDKESWWKVIEHHDITLPEGAEDYNMDYAIDMAIKALVASNNDLKTIDFDDMVYLPLLLKMRLFQYDYVLIDEAQDINATKLALAQAMLKPNGRLVAVGDAGQAIYGFTGADAYALQNIKTAFNAVSLPLSICYRCGKNIIAFARQFNPNIEAFDKNPEGKVSSMNYADFIKAIPSYSFSGNDAILCRKNAPLTKLAFSFIRQGIPCRIEGKDIGTGLKNLCKKWRVQTLVKLTERLNAYSMREQEKWEKKDEPMMMEQVSDKVNTLLALIARCQELNQHSVNDVILLIDSMFSDSSDGQPQNILTLCSVHKSKGLEWDRVFLLDRPQFMPSKMARKDWQKVQENNLIYVAITRAVNELVEITDYPSPNA